MAGYSNKTKIYEIPSPGTGDFISEASEERAANIIENQLVGAISAHSGGHGILKTGTFATSGDSGGFTVTLSSSGSTPTIQAFIRFISIRMFNPLQWVLTGDGLHTLYVKLVESSTQSSREYGEVVVGSNTTGTVPDDGLLVATATVSGNSITLDTQPITLLKIDTIEDHIADNVNPHTSHLVQDWLFASGINAQSITAQFLLNNGILINSGQQIVNGDARFNQSLYIDGNFIVSGIALVTGESHFSGQSFFQKLYASQVTVSSGLVLHGYVRFFNNIHLASGVTVDGRDLSRDGQVLDDHVFGASAFINPHRVTAAQVSGIPHTGSANGGPTLLGNLNVLSGIAIDGVDVSELGQLLNGQNADHLHTHAFSGLQVQLLHFSPEYSGMVFSGNGIYDINTSYDVSSGITMYNLNPQSAGVQNYVMVKRVGVPSDFKSWVANDAVQLTHGISSGMDASSRINITFADTAGTILVDPNGLNLQKVKMSQTNIGNTVLNTGKFDKGRAFAIFISVYTNGTTGTTASIGDLVLKYNTVYSLT